MDALEYKKVGAAVMLLLLGTIIGRSSVTPMSQCYEDSILMWEGYTNAHTNCVPLDNVIESAIVCWERDDCDIDDWFFTYQKGEGR